MLQIFNMLGGFMMFSLNSPPQVLNLLTGETENPTCNFKIYTSLFHFAVHTILRAQ